VLAATIRERKIPAATSAGKWKPAYTTEKPMKYDKSERMIPHRRLSYSINIGIAKPKANIVVVEGNEKPPVSQGPITRTV
jgi:hypothetical protein